MENAQTVKAKTEIISASHILNDIGFIPNHLQETYFFRGGFASVTSAIFVNAAR